MIDALRKTMQVMGLRAGVEACISIAGELQTGAPVVLHDALDALARTMAVDRVAGGEVKLDFENGESARLRLLMEDAVEDVLPGLTTRAITAARRYHEHMHVCKDCRVLHRCSAAMTLSMWLVEALTEYDEAAERPLEEKSL
jgi:hypothetical protein